MFHEAEAPGEGGDVFFEAEGLGREIGERFELFAFQFGAEGVGEQVHGHELAGVGFGGGDAFFLAGAHEQGGMAEFGKG